MERGPDAPEGRPGSEDGRAAHPHLRLRGPPQELDRRASHKTEPGAALWLTFSRRAPGARLTPNALGGWCERAGAKAGLKKENPYPWRHSAATERARLGWNEAQMRAFFGWTRGSDMPSVYTHLAGLDCDDMEIERRGIKRDGKVNGPALTSLTCKYCDARNVPTATFCVRCRRPISPDAEKEIEHKRQTETLAQARALLDALGIKADPEQVAMLVNQAMERRGAVS